MKIKDLTLAWLRKNTWHIYCSSLLFAALPMLLFLFGAYKLLNYTATQRVVAQSSQSATLLGKLVEEHISQSIKYLQSIAARSDMLREWSAGDIALLGPRLARAQATNPDFQWLAICDTRGIVRVMAPENQAVLNQDYHATDWYEAVMKRDKPYISEVREMPAGSPFLATFAVPIQDAEGRSAGILIGAQSVESVMNTVYQLSTSGMTSVSIVDQSGHLYGRNSAKQIVLEGVTSPSIALGKTSSNVLTRGREKVLEAYAPLPSTGWGMLLSLPLTAVQKALWVYEQGLGILGLIIIGLALLSATFKASLYRQLRDSEERNRLILEKASEAFVMTDCRSRITEWNAQAQASFGWTREEVLGRHFDEVLSPTLGGRTYAETIASQLRKSDPEFSLRKEIRVRRKDGQEVPAEIAICPIQGCKQVAFDAFLRDISERKLYQSRIEEQNRQLEARNREVERANTLKSRFLAAMSHELRTPLNAILGFAGLLAEDQGLAAKQRRWIEHIQNGGTHLLKLINEILDLSKIEAGQLELNIEVFPLENLVQEIASNFLPTAAEKRIRLKWHVQPGLALKADRIRVKQVLYNLISNALKFTPEHGTVTVRAERNGELAQLSVEDTGIGIREEEQAAIFEEFRQVGEAKDGVIQGTGLGLAITRQLIELHNGSISVKSSLGQGTRFDLTLPAATAAQISLPQPASNVIPTSTDREKLVLVVDDDPLAVELLCRYISSAGYKTASASSVEEAVDMARSIRPAAITLDVLLRETTGFAALCRIRREPEISSIPVIIVSVVDHKTLGFALGATDYLMKPIDRPTIVNSLRKHVGLPSWPGAKVLAVDDDPPTLNLIEEVLSPHGYDVLCAENGKKALRLLEKNRVDAILLDLVMPEMNGFDVLESLRGTDAFREIPIFVLSGHDVSPREREILERQATAYFHKDAAWRQALIEEIGRVIAQKPLAEAQCTGS